MVHDSMETVPLSYSSCRMDCETAVALIYSQAWGKKADTLYLPESLPGKADRGGTTGLLLLLTLPPTFALARPLLGCVRLAANSLRCFSRLLIASSGPNLGGLGI